ncbi:multiprotein-bridging factor 1b-like [Trifolium medium]|uniref:Multiprotein-bridging factor 1b-like n=1 Tax=Trifolium medium TaxID=97028 RepID=A0A392NAS1_9FABA|nr:multiprotein-bridging factor 1b-like [Trifolium medium]
MLIVVYYCLTIVEIELSNDRVPTELKKAIMQARTDKKLTQAQLAQIINEKPQVIQEYESGKAIPNQQIIGKLERALGAKLRGKK